MKQWEYCVLDENWDVEDLELMNVFNTLGDAGWELVSTHEKSKVGMMDHFVGSCLSAKIKRATTTSNT